MLIKLSYARREAPRRAKLITARGKIISKVCLFVSMHVRFFFAEIYHRVNLKLHLILFRKAVWFLFFYALLSSKDMGFSASKTMIFS